MNRPLFKKIQGNLEKQLQRIENIAEKKGEEIEKKNYEKYKYLYDICLKFLKKYDPRNYWRKLFVGQVLLQT